jgi:hypothetical protein
VACHAMPCQLFMPQLTLLPACMHGVSVIAFISALLCLCFALHSFYISALLVG